MANHKSSVKRARQEKKRSARNRASVSATRTAIKKIHSATAENKKDEAAKHLTTVQSLLGRLAKRGIIKKNTAARKTARLAARIAKLS